MGVTYTHVAPAAVVRPELGGIPQDAVSSRIILSRTFNVHQARNFAIPAISLIVPEKIVPEKIVPEKIAFQKIIPENSFKESP
jgi:hypothetical protein